MTHIIKGFSSKKVLKEALSLGAEVRVEDPSEFNTRNFLLNPEPCNCLGCKFNAEQGLGPNSPSRKICFRESTYIPLQPGESVVCTNHPKRSFFAKITRSMDGKSYTVE